jgi:3D (Asp-Asp-Asp) domain-containing protein
MVITAYSSSWYETTGIPGVPGIITASGKHVADGIIASNILPFGTKVRIPSLYGNKVFIVEDRMNARYNGKQRADIWMPSHTEAKVFGVKTANVEIVES